jgi:hypothetical protein
MVFGTAQALNSRVGQPEQARGQSPRIKRSQDPLSQLGHQRLSREGVAVEQIRQALRLIVRGRKDAGAHRAVLGFADKQTAQQVGETVKDLRLHQREGRDEIKQGRW